MNNAPPFGSPVLLVAFNRPESTRRVLEALATAGVNRLYVSLDGPREGRPDEAARCAEVVDLIENEVWADQVIMRRSPHNLGCRDGVTAGLDWFFELETEGIVLEDDCLPGEDFLPFCGQMLARYRDDHRIWQVSGTNLLGSWRPSRSDYFFGEGSIWGWATWRRAWSHRDIDMQRWGDQQARDRARQFLGPIGWRSLADNYASVAAGEIDTWDYQWSWTRASSNGLSVIPARNLISNIGFGPDATHTVRKRWPAEMPTASLKPPLRAPARLRFDRGFQAALMARSDGVAAVRSLGSRALRRTIGRSAWEQLRTPPSS